MNIARTILSNPSHRELPAVFSENSTWTYARLAMEVEQRAAAYPSASDARTLRWGLIGSESPAWLAEALAIIHAGHCLVPISEDYRGSSLDGFIHSARLGGMTSATTTAFEPRLLPHTNTDNAIPEPEFHALSPAFIRFTSGTTRERKGVVISHRSAMARVQAANLGMQIGAADRVLWLLPMAHHFVASILLYLSHGAAVILAGGLPPDRAWNLARQHHATVIYAAPEDYTKLLPAVENASPLTSLRLAVSTASGLTPQLAARFKQSVGLPLTQTLGVIEAGLPAINLLHAVDKPTSVGRALDGFQIRLLDDRGREITGHGTEHSGEMFISGPGLFDAYLNPWHPASSIMTAHGLSTGDWAYRDQDGDLFVVGRRANRIERDGHKFFCEDVEAVLNLHPAVCESRVYANGDNALHAELVLVDPQRVPDADALRQFLGNYLQVSEIPQHLHAVTGINKTPTGKIRRW